MIKIKRLKRKTTGWLLCCMCLLSGMCLACSDDDDYDKEATISGIVMDSESNWPIDGVSIVLYDGSNDKSEVFSSIITEIDGRFNFTINIRLMKTTYYLSAKKIRLSVLGEESYIRERKGNKIRYFNET